MIPVIIIAIFWWAGSGVVASVKAARASEPGTDTPGAKITSSKSATAPNASPSPAATPNTGPAHNPSNVTFGQWQRSVYRRWKKNLRDHLPGQRHGRKVADLFGDITAASLAGAAIFGLGFASGTTWTAKKRTARNANPASKTQRQPGTPKNKTPPSSGWRRARNQRPATPTTGAPGFTSRRRSTTHGQTPPRYSTSTGGDANNGGVIDAELIDDGQPPTAAPNPSQYTSSEYADLVNQPQLLANNPTTNTTAPNGHPMAEILTIHHLLRWAQGAFEHAVNVIEQSKVRASSAIERASNALVRSNTAIARRDTAVAVADTAHEHAVQLQATADRFSTLRMDPASMTSIGVGITTGVGLAQAERRRAEAEAEVARWASGLAIAEQAAAEAAQGSAQAAAIHAEAIKNMHDTVRRHQMPHAEALAATGNDAAHPSLLAAG